MSTEITKISELNEDLVREQQDVLTTFLAEKYPDIDLSCGVMHDLVQYLNAIFAAKEQAELDRVKSARSLLAIKENPDIADTDSVDNILSNFNVVRREGTYAVGTIFLEFSADGNVIVPAKTEFVYEDLKFSTQSSFVIYPSDTTGINAVADRILIPLTNGNYGCTIPVVANQVGTSSCIKRGTALQAANITYLVSAIAYNDFYGGNDAETNEELLLRLKSGIATPCWGNRLNIESLLRNSDTTKSIIDVSVIGMNDAEMTRDQITLFPISTGGKTDVYVKSSATTATVTEQVYATLYDKDLTYDYWSMVVKSNTLPSFWRVTGIELVNDTPNKGMIQLDSQTVQSSRDDIDVKDVGYTIYQVMDVKFRTPADSNNDINTIKPFNVTMLGIPNIEYLQDICNDRAIMPVASDVLVKAAVPCIVTANMVIKQSKKNKVSDAVINDIKDIIAKTINNKGFSGYLTVAELTNSVKQLLYGEQNIASLQLNGVIFGPTGTMYRDVSNKQIVIPEMPLNYISPRTTTFFSDITYIDVELNTIDE